MVAIVYLVAGMSSRYGNNIKQMAKIGPNNETLIEYSVKQALKNKFSKIVFITNKRTEYLFKNIFGQKYKSIPVLYVQQKYDENTRSRPWGTTDALCSIIDHINEPFIIVNGDDLYGDSSFKKGFQMMMNNDTNIIGCIRMDKILPIEDANRGVIFTKNGYVIGMKEMLKVNRINNPELLNEYGNVNFIGLQYSALKYIKMILDQFKNEHKGNKTIECLLPDSLNLLIENGILKMKYFEITEEILGITYPGDEIKVRNKIINKK